MLRRIVFSPFDFITLAAADPTIDGVWDNDDPAPFLVLYQHGKSVWAGPSETQVTSPFMVQPYLTPFLCMHCLRMAVKGWCSRDLAQHVRYEV